MQLKLHKWSENLNDNVAPNPSRQILRLARLRGQDGAAARAVRGAHDVVLRPQVEHVPVQDLDRGATRGMGTLYTCLLSKVFLGRVEERLMRSETSGHRLSRAEPLPHGIRNCEKGK